METGRVATVESAAKTDFGPCAAVADPSKVFAPKPVETFAGAEIHQPFAAAKFAVASAAVAADHLDR